ncbi:MAG: phosphoribosylglycinamide formyltransferase [Geminicoccaceae bacterium]
MARRRTAVLISGNGSNLQALLDAAADPAYPAEIVLVIANRPAAYGLVRAELAGVPSRCIDHRAFANREAFDAAMQAELERAEVDLVCLAGFMRLLTPGFVAHWRDRLVNIHPSLLPAFPGLDTHARALKEGCALAGCTVHLVRYELDTGPVLVQGAVPVLPGDTEETLAGRVLEVEHPCYVRALDLFASGRFTVDGEVARLRDERPGERLLLHPLLLAPAGA